MNFPKQPKTLFNRKVLAALLATSLLSVVIPAQADERLERMESRLYELEDRRDSLITDRSREEYGSKEYWVLDNQINRLKSSITSLEREIEWAKEDR